MDAASAFPDCLRGRGRGSGDDSSEEEDEDDAELPMLDFYKILKVPRDANPSRLRSAYHKLALYWNPEQNGWQYEARSAEVPRPSLWLHSPPHCGTRFTHCSAAPPPPPCPHFGCHIEAKGGNQWLGRIHECIIAASFELPDIAAYAYQDVHVWSTL